jgi:hypothetical protein
LYLFQRRGRPPEMLGLFDGPGECTASCSQRITSTTPLQSLYLLNDPFWLRASEVLEQMLTARAGTDDPAFVEAAFRAVLQRAPGEDDLSAALGLMRSIESDRAQQHAADMVDGRRRPSARVLLCEALFNLSEAVFLE